ncbi:MAG: hypothetical protein NC311_04235 [Muribaculaceae bacterium]|nr:hypothetical protein [Muribaculaceae bacterium]
MFRIFCFLMMISAPTFGAVLHIGNYYQIQLSVEKQSSPSLAVVAPSGKIYYAALGADCGQTKVLYKDSVLEICNAIEPTYTRLEYLESDGRQYIDTGIIPTGTMSFEIKTYVAVSNATSTGHVPLGARTHINSQEWYYQISTFNKFLNGYMGYGPAKTIDGHLRFRDINVISLINGLYTINQDYTYQYDIYEFPSEFKNTLYMFRLNSKDSNTVAPDWFTGKIYYVKIWDGDKMLRDYIPVLDSDGIPSMYDRVSGRFFYNLGTGQFRYGN